MENPAEITLKTLSAYVECPRKAFLTFRGHKGDESSLETLLEKRAMRNLKCHFKEIRELNFPIEFKAVARSKFLAKVTLNSQGLHCSVYLHENNGGSWVPVIPIGSVRPKDSDKMKLAFAGYLMSLCGAPAPTKGMIIAETGKRGVLLEPFYPKIRKSLTELREIQVSEDAPKVSLRPSCQSCPFWSDCHSKAIEIGDLSLFPRIGAKRIEKLNRKGIYSIEQLALTYRPRRKRRTKSKKASPSIYQPSLHALALKQHKVLIEEMPELHRSKCELFLDIEGLPDQNFYYLAGILVRNLDECKEYSFWADGICQEKELFLSLIKFLRQYHSAPIYHYGRYDANALDELSCRYEIDSSNVMKRLVNANKLIYAKIYFPVYSNSLKDLGHYLGVSWPSSSKISSVSPIAWRYSWEDTGDDEYKDRLVAYNLSDCRAVSKLVDEIENIQSNAEIDSAVGFVNQGEKQCTEVGKKIHAELKNILVSGHANYEKRKIAFVSDKSKRIHARTCAKKPIRPDVHVRVRRRLKCPRCHGTAIQPCTDRTSEVILTDLVFTKHGCRRRITRYYGYKIRCIACKEYYSPKRLQPLKSRRYGDGFIA